MPTLLDRYLGARFLSTAAKILLSLIALFVLIDVLTHRQSEIINYQIPLGIVAEYYATFIPTLLFNYQGVALAVLVSALMVLGRSAQDQEVTAALAGGISLRRLSLSLIVLALLIAVGSWFAQESWGVAASRRATDIEEEYFSRFAGDNRKGVSFAHLEGGWTAHALKFNREALTGEDVFLHRISENTMQEIRARRIYWEPATAKWMLEDGRKFSFDFSRQWEQRVERITLAPAPFSAPPEELFVLDESASEKSASALRKDLQRADELGLDVDRQWVEYYAKSARAALAFVMVWLAIPFALRVRRGGLAVGFGMSLAIGLTYMLVFYACIGLGWIGAIGPVAAAWTANAVFMAFGLLMYYRTAT